jgi:hypothetical protein
MAAKWAGDGNEFITSIGALQATVFIDVYHTSDRSPLSRLVSASFASTPCADYLHHRPPMTIVKVVCSYLVAAGRDS